MRILLMVGITWTTASVALGINFQGLNHDALGGASLSIVSNNDLVVSNIGSSGLDGVSIDLPNFTEGFITDLKFPSALADPVVPGTVERVMTATIGGVPNQEFLRLTFEPKPGGIGAAPPIWRITPDFSAIGATTYSLTSILGTVSGLSGPAIDVRDIGLPEITPELHVDLNFFGGGLGVALQLGTPHPVDIIGGPCPGPASFARGIFRRSVGWEANDLR